MAAGGTVVLEQTLWELEREKLFFSKSIVSCTFYFYNIEGKITDC